MQPPSTVGAQAKSTSYVPLGIVIVRMALLLLLGFGIEVDALIQLFDSAKLSVQVRFAGY